MKKVYIAYAPSAIHFGNCFLGASCSRSEARKMAGRAGYVMDFPSLEAALEAYPEWEEGISCDL